MTIPDLNITKEMKKQFFHLTTKVALSISVVGWYIITYFLGNVTKNTQLR